MEMVEGRAKENIVGDIMVGYRWRGGEEGPGVYIY